MNRVQEEYNRTRSLRNQDRSIRGTFVRKQAIENDYIHFFAPGDAVFESIVDNALNSCKGQVSAFAIPSSINWCGLIFTWSMYPNDTYLIKKDVSFYALSPYRNYLMADQVVTPIPITNNDSISNESIVREYEQIVSKGFKPKGIVHLGKRSSSPGFLSELVDKKENINWFKSVYPDERWSEFVTNARESAAKQAFSIFNKKSNIRGAKEEMQRSLSARAANSEYYGLDDDDLESLQSTQEIIIDAMRHPKINLESAAFVWMVKMNYE